MLIPFGLLSQENYKLKALKLGGGTNRENVFGPFVSGEYLYYSSDKKTKSAKSIVNEDGSSFTDIYRVKIKKNKVSGRKQHLNNAINSVMNDGFVHITKDDSLLYFNRNMNNEDDESKSGIFYSKNINDTLCAAIPFKHNNISYNVVHPTISEDESLMIFASDMPGGKGLSDLYYCEYINGEWSEPKNIGPQINTEFRESTPYLYKNQLFFNSDRPGGIGEKDLYVSNRSKDGWTQPKNLGEPINSPKDDFSIFLIDGMQEGYFSTNRKTSLDHIIYFNSQLPRPDTFHEVEPNFCFIFKDEEYETGNDIELVWDMGNGIIKKGNNFEYCFDKIGAYSMSLNIIDHSLEQEYKNIHQQDIEILTDDKPYIVHEIQDSKHIFYVDIGTCNTVYDKYYWVVDGNLRFEKQIVVEGPNHEIKYISWNEADPEKVVGVIKKYD